MTDDKPRKRPAKKAARAPGGSRKRTADTSEVESLASVRRRPPGPGSIEYQLEEGIIPEKLRYSFENMRKLEEQLRSLSRRVVVSGRKSVSPQDFAELCDLLFWLVKFSAAFWGGKYAHGEIEELLQLLSGEAPLKPPPPSEDP